MSRLTLALVAALVFVLVAACGDKKGTKVQVVTEEAPKAAPAESEAEEPKEPEAKPEPAEPKEREVPRHYDKRDMPIPAPEDVKKPPKGAQQTEAGVYYRVIEEGEGKSPKTDSAVTVHYTGWTTNGKMFDSSHKDGEPSSFRVTGVIAGWTDILMYMSPGSSYRVWIPEKLAYKGKPGRPAGMLVFDIKLLEIQ